MVRKFFGTGIRTPSNQHSSGRMSSARAGKGPVKADHTIYKPSGADTPSSSLPGKTATEWLRKTPSPTGDRLRKSPSPTSAPALRAHTPSPTSFGERLRKTPSPRTAGQRPLVSPITRPASTTPRKTPSPSESRRSPDPSPGGSAAASRRTYGPRRSTGPAAIKRSMSAVQLPRHKGEPGLARSQPPSRSGGSGSRATPPTPSLDGDFSELRRFLPGQDMKMVDALASRLKELRRIGGRTLEAGTQTVSDVGTQTQPTGGAAAGGAADDGDDRDDREVAQLALAGTERGVLHAARAGGTPSFLRRSRSSSAGSEAAGFSGGLSGGYGSRGGGDYNEGGGLSTPVEMVMGLGISSHAAAAGSIERPRQPKPLPVHAGGADAHAQQQRSARSTPERRERLLGDGAAGAAVRARLVAAEHAEQAPTRQMRPTPGSVLHALTRSQLARERESAGEWDTDTELAAAAAHAAQAGPEPPGLLEGASLGWNTDDENDDDMRELDMSRRDASRLPLPPPYAAYAHAPGPDPIKMLSDGKHNVASMFGTGSTVSRSMPSSPHTRLARLGSRGFAIDSPRAAGGDTAIVNVGIGIGVGSSSSGGHVAHTGLACSPILRDATTEQTPVRSAERDGESEESTLSAGAHAHRRTGSWGVDDVVCAGAHAAAKSPKQNGTSLFGADLAAGAGEISLPVPARPARTVPRLDLRETERPHSAPGDGQGGARALGGRLLAGGDGATKDATRASPRGLVTSHSDVSIGSPRSAFTSVSSPRSQGGSTNSTPRNPLPPIAGQPHRA